MTLDSWELHLIKNSNFELTYNSLEKNVTLH